MIRHKCALSFIKCRTDIKLETKMLATPKPINIEHLKLGRNMNENINKNAT